MLSRNQDHSTARRIKAMKNTLTQLVIEPETFRLIAQYLNQLGRCILVVGEPLGSQSCLVAWYFEVMFIIRPSSFKEWYAMTSSFQIIVDTITIRLSELYIFSSKYFPIIRFGNWKNLKIKLQKSRNNTVLVFSSCSKPITHRLVVCLSQHCSQSKQRN